MCGIFGIVAHNASVSLELLERATASLAHRGPDDSGTTIIRENVPEPVEIGLGNRRLAVLDVTTLGHQPMHDPQTGNWIAYNGEIYNFRDIRARLQKEGIDFHSHSDTEVLLKAYGHWGEACLQQLRGMFAFAIWDAKRRLLFMARDHLGIKPLYYCRAGQNFIFASEVRTLLETGLIPRRIDSAGLINYLSFGSTYDPVTLVEGVSAVQAGHQLTWQGGKVCERRYWDAVPESGSTPTVSNSNQERMEAEVHATLAEAVQMQMVSDVPVGVFLSGGIDSSSLVALLQRSGIRPNTFSIVFREPAYNEAQYSRLVAKAFGTEHQEILVSVHDAMEAIPLALKAADQPSIDGINTYLISRQTRAAGIKVALTGLGGDEVFAGYSSFQSVPKMERFNERWSVLPKVARRPLASMLGLFLPQTDQNRKLRTLLADAEAIIHPYFLSRMLFTPVQLQAILQSRGDSERANASLRESVDRSRSLDEINRVSYLETRSYMLNTLLRDADGMSMAHGLELRVPLIDAALVRQVLALPGRWKVQPGTPKPLLIGAVKAMLPREIIQRSKRGFTLPFEQWLRSELRTDMESVLARVFQRPLSAYLNPDRAQRVWADFLARRTSWSRAWSLYVLQRWCELNAMVA